LEGTLKVKIVYEPLPAGIKAHKFYPGERCVLIDDKHLAVWVDNQLIQADRPLPQNSGYLRVTNEPLPSILYAHHTQIAHIARERITLPFALKEF
jgi:hypothetical protein